MTETGYGMSQLDICSIERLHDSVNNGQIFRFTYSFNAIVCYTKCACAWFNMSVIQNVTTGTIDSQKHFV